MGGSAAPHLEKATQPPLLPIPHLHLSVMLRFMTRSLSPSLVPAMAARRATSTTIPLKPDPRLANLAVSRAELVQTLSMQIKNKVRETIHVM